MADHKAPAFASAPTDLGFHHRCLAANVDVVKDLALKYPMSTHTESRDIALVADSHRGLDEKVHGMEAADGSERQCHSAEHKADQVRQC